MGKTFAGKMRDPFGIMLRRIEMHRLVHPAMDGRVGDLIAFKAQFAQHHRPVHRLTRHRAHFAIGAKRLGAANEQRVDLG